MTVTPEKLTPDEISHILTIWEKTIDVQMHFNDIGMRIRNLFISVMLAVVGAIGWVTDKEYELSFWIFEVKFSMLLLTSGLISAYLFLLMDKYWYHQLLKASVSQAQALDNRYGKLIPALGLTSKISVASPIKGFKNSYFGKLCTFLNTVKKDSYSGNDLRSTGKIEIFYIFPIRIFQILLVLAIFSGGLTYDGESITKVIISLFVENKKG